MSLVAWEVPALLIFAALGPSQSGPAAITAQSSTRSLEQDLQAAVEMLRPQLPLTMSGVIIDDVRAHGTELIYHMKIPLHVEEDGIQRFRDALPVQVCANRQTRALLDQGGTFTYNVDDSDGHQFTASVSGCNGSAPASSST